MQNEATTGRRFHFNSEETEMTLTSIINQSPETAIHAAQLGMGFLAMLLVYVLGERSERRRNEQPK